MNLADVRPKSPEIRVVAGNVCPLTHPDEKSRHHYSEGDYQPRDNIERWRSGAPPIPQPGKRPGISWLRFGLARSSMLDPRPGFALQLQPVIFKLDRRIKGTPGKIPVEGIGRLLLGRHPCH